MKIVAGIVTFAALLCSGGGFDSAVQGDAIAPHHASDEDELELERSNCAPDGLAVGASGVCRGDFDGIEEGDYFHLGLRNPETSFFCGPCMGCTEHEMGQSLAVYWEVMLEQLPDGSPRGPLPMVQRCEVR